MKIKDRLRAIVWKYLLAGIQEGVAMQRIWPLIANGPYIPWSASALSAPAILAALNDITVNGRSTIVECGSGISTTFIGCLLKERNRPGSHLYTIEHDAGWCELVRRLIADYGLTDWVTSIHAPLTGTELSWSGEHWYDPSILHSQLGDRSIDLLLVDGPPSHEPSIRFARYPAARFFKELLSERYCIILDDINRRAERDILHAWESELGISFQRRSLNGNYSVGTRGAAYTI